MLELWVLELFSSQHVLSFSVLLLVMVIPVTPVRAQKVWMALGLKLRHGAVSGVGVFLGSCDKKHRHLALDCTTGRSTIDSSHGSLMKLLQHRLGRAPCTVS